MSLTREGYYSWKDKLRKERPNSSLKTDKFPRYYYHVTTDSTYSKWGKRSFIMPLSGQTMNRPVEEPSNARTCVAPSIAHCFAAIAYGGHAYDFYVYRTASKITAHYPYGVEDAPVTQEKWIILPVEMVLVAYFDTEWIRKNKLVPMDNWNAGDSSHIKKQRRLLKAWQKALKSGTCQGLYWEQGYEPCAKKIKNISKV